MSGNASSEVLLKFLVGKEAGLTYAISKPITTIGRDPANDIVFSDQFISRNHAQIIHDGAQWSIENISNGNMLMVNQRMVQQAPLEHNDNIALGSASVAQLLFTKSGGLNVSPSVPRLKTQRMSVPHIEVSGSIFADKPSYELTQSTITIGRDPANDIVINVPIVSGFHAQLVQEAGGYVLVHPQSPPRPQSTLNGLLYEGRHIPGDTPFRSKPLKRGDIFRIGDVDNVLVTLSYDDGTSNPQEVIPAAHPIQLGDPIIYIGRDPASTVVLDHPQVSSHHARLEMEQMGQNRAYRIVDMGSTNHTYVNKQPASNQILQIGDEISIGPFRLTYTDTALQQRDESNCIRVDAQDLTKVIDGKVLLNKISLVIPPRKFVALVGGSGAGKSTLMDALAGLRPAHKGKVFYNGQDYYASAVSFSTQLGYVPQKDIVHEDITVERALFYAAKLRLPDDFTNAQIKQRITEVLDEMGMQQKRDLRVSKLSGGQKKRVSIALELLAKPSIFFLDEPTSGLDPGLDQKMMFLLRNLADKGQTIVLVTHATNNIDFCDYVCFLAQGGRMAYFGPPAGAKAYFHKTDFAHIYNELAALEDKPLELQLAEDHFKQDGDYKKYVAEPLSYGSTMRTLPPPQTASGARKRGNMWKQFIWLALRYLELLKNDKANRWILILQAPIIGLLLALFIVYGMGSVGGSGGFDPNNIVQCPVGPLVIFNGQPNTVPRTKASFLDCQHVDTFLSHAPAGKAYVGKRSIRNALQDFIVPGPGNASRILFMMAFTAVLFGCINGAREIVKELPIYMRERTVNLGIIPYLFSKIVIMGVLCLLQSLIIVLMVNLVDPLQKSILLTPILEVYITIVLTALVGLMLGLTVSAIVSNTDRATSIIPVVLIPQVIFSGVLFPLTNKFLQVFGMLFPTRWAMVALGSTVGIHSDKVGGDALWGSNDSYHGLIYSLYSKGDAMFYLLLSWGVLLFMSVLLVLVTGYLLKKKDVRV